MKIRHSIYSTRNNETMDNLEFSQYKCPKWEGHRDLIMFEPHNVSDKEGNQRESIVQEHIDGVEIKWMKVTCWEAGEFVSQKGEVGWLNSIGQEALKSPDTEEHLIKKLYEASESLNYLNATWEERNIYNELRELEIKSHLENMDKKLEILNLKHEHMQLIVDSLVADLNKHVNQKHENKQEKGKTSVARDREETLEKFSQASFDLRETLDGENEALDFDWDIN